VNREAAVIVSLATAFARAPETFTDDQKETQA
jgi:hypothetical protein